jgi:hypothetical protein
LWLAVSNFEEFPEVLGELSLDDLKEFCAQNDIKAPRARAGIVQAILERFGTLEISHSVKFYLYILIYALLICETLIISFLSAGSECLVEFLQRWKVTHLELMTHYWGASNHAAATKLEKAMLIESYLANGYINYGDPNVRTSFATYF